MADSESLKNSEPNCHAGSYSGHHVIQGHRNRTPTINNAELDGKPEAEFWQAGAGKVKMLLRYTR